MKVWAKFDELYFHKKLLLCEDAPLNGTQQKKLPGVSLFCWTINSQRSRT